MMTTEGGLLASTGGAHWQRGAPYSPALGSLVATIWSLRTEPTSAGVSIQQGVSTLPPLEVLSFELPLTDAVLVGSASLDDSATSRSALQPDEPSDSKRTSVAERLLIQTDVMVMRLPFRVFAVT